MAIIVYTHDPMDPTSANGRQDIALFFRMKEARDYAKFAQNRIWESGDQVTTVHVDENYPLIHQQISGYSNPRPPSRQRAAQNIGEGMKILNLTWYTANIHGPNNEGIVMTLPPEPQAAILPAKNILVGAVNGVGTYRVEYGPVEGLPEPKDGVIYYVSNMVRRTVPWRRDVVSPGELLFDESGACIGCRGFEVNE